MIITKLKIEKFHILQDLEITFNHKDNSPITYILGQNGSGKSTILEVIVRILKDIDQVNYTKKEYFNYELSFIAGEVNYILTCQDKKYSLKQTLNEDELYIYQNVSQQTLSQSFKSFRGIINLTESENLRLMPKRIISLYPGHNNFLSEIYKPLHKRYKELCKGRLKFIHGIIEQTGTLIYEEMDTRGFPELRYIYNEQINDVLFLSSIFWSNDSESIKDIIKKHTSIKKVDTLFVSLKSTPITTPIQFISAFSFLTEKDISLQEVYHELKTQSYSPSQRILESFELLTKKMFLSQLEYIEQKISPYIKCIYSGNGKFDLTIDFNQDMLNVDNGLTRIDIYNFLEKLQSIYNAEFEMLFDDELNNKVKSERISDGERQFLRLVGLLSLYKNENAIILLDEPDTHMNPKWKYSINEIIKECSNSNSNQIIITTHEPLMINGIEHKLVRKLEKDESGKINAYELDQDTYGMGIDGLLQSEYYGLRTSYDKETSEKYEKRLDLYRKVINETATPNEKEELVQLTMELGDLPCSNTTIDFLYSDFILEYRKSEYYLKEYLTFEETLEKRVKIQNIIKQLFKRN